jgi:hypothetical protein
MAWFGHRSPRPNVRSRHGSFEPGLTVDLPHHLQVIWRQRLIVAIGAVLGIVLAILAAYHIPSMERRGKETWMSQSDIFVTQSGFPWGRVTLPGSEVVAGTDGATSDSSAKFADPTRFSALAMLYSVMADSDRVRELLPRRLRPGQLEATAVDATGNGTSFLPIIRITTRASTAGGAKTLNKEALKGMETLLTGEQESNGIPASDRVQLSTLNRPSDPVLEVGRSWTASILALLLACAGAVFVAHLVEGLRMRRQATGGLSDTARDQDARVRSLTRSKKAAAVGKRQRQG